jgi:hypothetical protein
MDERDLLGATPYLVAAKAKRWDIVRKYTKTVADLRAID